MKNKFVQGQTVYYIDWQDNDKKIPAVVVNARRSWATVRLNVGIFKWELTDVPMEDLVPTNDFTTRHSSLIGTAVIWKENNNA